MIRFLSILLFLCALGLSAQARRPLYPHEMYRVELVDANGRRLPSWQHRGQTYVMGHYGDRYQVRVQNRTGQRVEAVVSVDGRDVVSGDPGNYRTQRGYVIEPWGAATIDGFRQSLDSVATFRFTSPKDSYSARRGSPQNVGVIGVAIFAEDNPQATATPVFPLSPRWQGQLTDGTLGGDGVAEERSEDAESESFAAGRAAAPAAKRARPRGTARTSQIGTRYGESRHSTVVEAPFVRRSPTRPNHMMTLYYDNEAGLRARGVPVSPRRYVAPGPQPFPENNGFAPPP